MGNYVKSYCRLPKEVSNESLAVRIKDFWAQRGYAPPVMRIERERLRNNYDLEIENPATVEVLRSNMVNGFPVELALEKGKGK